MWEVPCSSYCFSYFKNFLFCIEFIGWHWLIQLCRFQVHNSVTHHLYVVVCVHQPSQVSFCHHLSPLYPLLPPPFPLVITILSSVSMRFCFVLFFLLNPFTFHPATQIPSSLTAVSLFSIYESVSVFFVNFVHDITHISEIIWDLSFYDWLISLSIMFSRCIHAVTNGKILFFFTAKWYSIM